jgi:hypothetical protein
MGDDGPSRLRARGGGGLKQYWNEKQVTLETRDGIFGTAPHALVAHPMTHENLAFTNRLAVGVGMRISLSLIGPR